mmetsp:Transcript_23562/g.35816  ORF Transcript_23562/g.35816 Transcript_23562/m.35816 type:complete len:269 (+) Transcript_23562:641-1447(+)
MKSQLGIIVHIDFHRVLAKLLAHRTNLLAQRGTKHHNLFLVGSHTEDFLNITSHIQRLQNAIALIQHKVLDVIQLERLLPRQSQHTARSSHHDVGTVVLDDVPVGLNGNSSVEYGGLDFGKVLRESFVLMGNLEGQFAGVAEDQDADLILPCWECICVQLVKGGEDKYSCFTHTTLGLTDDVHAKDRLRDTFVLDFGGVLKTTVDDRAETFWFENEILETRGMNSYIVTLLGFFAFRVSGLLRGYVLLFFLLVVIYKVVIFFVVGHGC